MFFSEHIVKVTSFCLFVRDVSGTLDSEYSYLYWT